MSDNIVFSLSTKQNPDSYKREGSDRTEFISQEAMSAEHELWESSQEHSSIESLLSDDNSVLSQFKFGRLKASKGGRSSVMCDAT